MKIIVVLAFLPFAVYADMITPSHHCSKPTNVPQSATQAERAAFDRQVRGYQQCLSDFINEQNKEARMHSEAARGAANELQRSGP